MRHIMERNDPGHSAQTRWPAVSLWNENAFSEAMAMGAPGNRRDDCPSCAGAWTANDTKL
jgi:hypothetical protein